MSPVTTITKERSACTQAMFVHLSDIVNTLPLEGDKHIDKTAAYSKTQLLLMAAKLAILDGKWDICMTATVLFSTP